VLGAQAANVIPPASDQPRFVSILEPAEWWWAVRIVPVAFVAALLVHVFVLERFPNSGDEYAYLWQATAFAAGEATTKSPEPQDAFRLNHIGDIGGRRFSKYPPGWPLLLAAGVRFGVPGLVNPLLAALALAGIFRIGCSWVGRRAAALGAAVTGTSPFFLMNAGSYHSHASCLFAVTALALALEWAVKRPGPWPVFFAGASVGLAVLIRPYTAFLLGVPILLAFAPGVLLGEAPNGHRSWSPRKVGLGVLWFVLGGLPFAAFLLNLNRVVTGSWWNLPWTYFDPVETLGFGPYGHTFYRGVKIAIRLCGEGILYTSFFGVFLLLLARGQRLPHKTLLWILLLAPIVGYVFWWSNGGNRYGPRFYFEALLPFTLLAGIGLERLSRLGQFRGLVTLGACLTVSVFTVLAVGAHRQVHSRRELYRIVDAMGLQNAIVLLTTGSGDMVPSDLTRNPPDIEQATVLYGLSRGARDREVREAFPGRAIYRYRSAPTGHVISPAAFD
jgi:hypothetical protein